MSGTSDARHTLLVKLVEPTAPGMRATYTPPVGLWSIRQALEERGHQVTVIDMHIGDEIPDGDFDLFGVSVQFSMQHREYIGTVRMLRERWPEACIIAGGFHAALTEKPPEVDQVVFGPGEAFFSHDVSSRPRPTSAEMMRYWDRGAPHDLRSMTDRWMPIETSRGCGRACRFCAARRFWRGWQPTAGIEATIRHYADIGVRELFIEDDNLVWDADHARHVLRLMREHGMSWSTPNGIEARKALPLLDEFTGCWRLSLPFETGVESTARLMGLGDKWMPFDEAVDAVQRIRNRGIGVCGFFIIGYPGETLDDVRRTLDYANRLPLDDRHIYIATPYPGTPLYDLCKREGYLVADGPDLWERLQYTVGLIRTPEWDPEDITQIRADDRARAIARRAAARSGGA